ncbi:RidA family protein [Psychromicrobium sp. YIM B11713]|uniref:RidA family protein n=1 Tax=Psychromicrobium sp. YIM B11713 TaxID=3145233 RepID=UPI00374F4A17
MGEPQNGAPAQASEAAQVGTSSHSAVERRLDELGRTLPPVPAPVAAYVPAVISGNHVFTSGQLPTVAGKLTASGKVGAEVSAEDAKECAALCAVNALAAVKSVIGDLDRITRVVKVVGFVSSDPAFTAQPAVINGASELLGQALGDAGVHARSAVGVSVLPLDAPVEVELIVEFQ